jgi:hypothetical protein
MQLSDLKIGGWIYSKATKRLFKITGLTPDDIRVHRPDSDIVSFPIRLLKNGTINVTTADDWDAAIRLVYIGSDKEKLVFLLKHEEAR